MSKKDKKDELTKIKSNDKKNGSWLSLDGKKEAEPKSSFEAFMDASIFYMSALCAALVITSQMKAYQQGVYIPTTDAIIGIFVLLLFNNITWGFLKKAGQSDDKSDKKKSGQDKK